MKQNQVSKGQRITYDDGRPGHQGVQATVLGINEEGMLVQFDDRADTDYIRFADKEWMDHIKPSDNPRFVLLVGAIHELFPDCPQPGGPLAGSEGAVVIWDRQLKQAAATLEARYGQALCLETTRLDGSPFSTLCDWLNGLSREAMESERLTATLPEYTVAKAAPMPREQFGQLVQEVIVTYRDGTSQAANLTPGDPEVGASTFRDGQILNAGDIEAEDFLRDFVAEVRQTVSTPHPEASE